MVNIILTIFFAFIMTAFVLFLGLACYICLKAMFIPYDKTSITLRYRLRDWCLIILLLAVTAFFAWFTGDLWVTGYGLIFNT